MANIAENLKEVRENISVTAEKCGRTKEDVRLVAVTKTYGVDVINEAIDLGVTDIGENRVQEILEKYDHVKPVRWHLIGHLQRNKVKYIIDKVAMIESVDRVSLADEIDKQAKKHGLKMKVLVEVNAGEEENKGGVLLADLKNMLSYVKGKENLELCGIMSVFPIGAEESLYEKVKQAYDEYKQEYNLSILSMGMSNDYITAVKHGATEVRLGSALFGARDYTKR